MVQIHSLKGDRAFQRLRKGRTGGAKYLSVRWLPQQEGSVAVGIVVSKKVGKAVVRNRVRRRLKEALKHILTGASLDAHAFYKQLPSLDLLILTRPEAAEADFWQLKQALETALKRGKLLL